MILGTFFDITADNVSSTIAYTKGIITDTSAIWILVIGVFLGLIVFEVVVNAIRSRH